MGTNQHNQIDDVPLDDDSDWDEEDEANYDEYREDWEYGDWIDDI